MRRRRAFCTDGARFFPVSTKATAAAKSFGGFLYSAVSKAGAKVSEAGAKIKKTVEENVSTPPTCVCVGRCVRVTRESRGDSRIFVLEWGVRVKSRLLPTYRVKVAMVAYRRVPRLFEKGGRG